MLLEKFAPNFIENVCVEILKVYAKSCRKCCGICSRKIESGKETEKETENVCGYFACL